LGDVIAPVGFNTPFPHLLGGGTIIFACQQNLLSRPLRSLPPLLELRPATKGTYPLGTPNSVPPNAVALFGGSVKGEPEIYFSLGRKHPYFPDCFFVTETKILVCDSFILTE